MTQMKDFYRKEGHEVSRFLGNRLHIIFHLGGVYFSIFENLKKFVLGLLPKNKLVVKLKDLVVEEAVEIELQILGIPGKMLSGPWMNRFYTDLKTMEMGN